MYPCVLQCSQARLEAWLTNKLLQPNLRFTRPHKRRIKSCVKDQGMLVRGHRTPQLLLRLSQGHMQGEKLDRQYLVHALMPVPSSYSIIGVSGTLARRNTGASASIEVDGTFWPQTLASTKKFSEHNLSSCRIQISIWVCCIPLNQAQQYNQQNQVKYQLCFLVCLRSYQFGDWFIFTDRGMFDLPPPIC